MGFPPNIAEKALVCCGRHCCLCHKFCGPKIELHHIVPESDGGEDTFENCTPLCFDCHADVGAYDSKHPKGRKYKASELKAHRDRWYSVIASRTHRSSSVDIDDPGSRFEITDLLPTEIPKKIKDTIQDSGSGTPDLSATSDHLRGIDYIHTASTEFEEELAALTEQIHLITQERESAKDLGLDGSARAAEDEMQSIQRRIQVLEQRIEIIKHGYDFWDKAGFEVACESYYFQYRWYCLAYAREDGGLTPGDDLHIRVPLEAQRALSVAVDSHLFEKFLICEALDDPIEVFDLELGDYDEIIEKGTYYLFGCPAWSDYDTFYIDQWEESYF
jgi:hypothetical protein